MPSAAIHAAWLRLAARHLRGARDPVNRTEFPIARV